MTRPGPRWRLRETLDWLIMEGRFAPGFNAFVEATGRRLVADGAPIFRFRLGFRTLHPLVTAVTSIWERDEQEVVHTEAEHGLERRATYVGSPMQTIAETKTPFRRRLEGTLGENDHIVLHELKAGGATDYFGCPLPFATDGAGIMVVTSDAPGGFTDEEIADLETLAAAVTPMVEIERLQRISTAVAEAYLGPRTGRRVLEGQITRGAVETIRAAVMFSDIRGWTGINRRLPAAEAMALANAYFERIDAAVDAHDGEILKLIGDGVLAIFPATADEAGARAACDRALAAARQALADGGGDAPAFGAGLHFGDVLYGNVGSERRLDFTATGDAVNLAARVEGLCARLDRSLLYTGAFAGAIASASRLVGREALKGVEGTEPIYEPATENDAD